MRAGVDASDGVVERQTADGDHEDGADDGGARAIDAQHGHAPERDDHVRASEDEGGNQREMQYVS